MEINIKDSLEVGKKREKGRKLIKKVVAFFKATSKMILKKGRELNFLQMDVSMLENGLMIKNKVKEHTFIKMAIDIKENGLMMSSMVWVF